jgi:hypothetical protein
MLEALMNKDFISPRFIPAGFFLCPLSCQLKMQRFDKTTTHWPPTGEQQDLG